MGERGTETSLFKYAHYNETILNNESYIITKHPSIHPYSHPDIIIKFKNRFPNRVVQYTNEKEIDEVVQNWNIDVFYAQKGGHVDGIISKLVKTVIHMVFSPAYPHGDVYACISESLSKKVSNGQLPFVPYIVELPDTSENMREELGIPSNATVFGRHGGKETFNLQMGIDAVKYVAQNNPQIYFLFLNTDKFIDLPNVIHLDTITDDVEKVKFINTCDAMIHARTHGETFGLAIAEFSIKNKPVITTGGYDNAHLDLLGYKGIYYSGYHHLVVILTDFKPQPNNNWDAYSNKYSPDKVMKKFQEVFLS